MKYTAYVIYSPSENSYVSRGSYWIRPENRLTSDPTKARIYSRKSDATQSLNIMRSKDRGFQILRREITAEDLPIERTRESLEEEIRALKEQLAAVIHEKINESRVPSPQLRSLTDYLGPLGPRIK